MISKGRYNNILENSDENDFDDYGFEEQEFDNHIPLGAILLHPKKPRIALIQENDLRTVPYITEYDGYNNKVKGIIKHYVYSAFHLNKKKRKYIDTIQIIEENQTKVKYGLIQVLNKEFDEHHTPQLQRKKFKDIMTLPLPENLKEHLDFFSDRIYAIFENNSRIKEKCEKLPIQ